MIFCSTANIIAYSTEFSSFFAYILNACGNPSLLCVLGNHLLIHLKEAAEDGRNEGTSYKPKMSSMSFAEDHAVSGTQYNSSEGYLINKCFYSLR